MPVRAVELRQLLRFVVSLIKLDEECQCSKHVRQPDGLSKLLGFSCWRLLMKHVEEYVDLLAEAKMTKLRHLELSSFITAK